MKISDILKGVEYEAHGICEDEEVINISTSPNECDKRTLLIITNSEKPHPEKELLRSFLAVVCDGSKALPEGVPYVKVKNSRAAAAYAYSNYYEIDYSKMKIVGITGTNGKTSTAYFLSEILNKEGYNTGFIGTGRIRIGEVSLSDDNYSMTTPDPSLLYKMLKRMELSGCTHVVMEVSSHSIALHKIDPIPFEVGIMTNLSPEHLDFHSDMEDYYKTKVSFLEKCRTALYNIDDGYCRRAFKERKGRRLSAGALFRGDSYATAINDLGLRGCEYLFRGEDFVIRIRLSVAGIYNVYNSMLAIACAIHLGIAPCRVKRGIEEIDSIEGRFEIIKDEVTVIIDYAHTDRAMEGLLGCLGRMKGRGELIAVFGAGGERDRSKRPRMAAAAERNADRIILTSDNPRREDPLLIIKDIEKGFEKRNYSVIPDRKEAITYAILNARRGDTVAIIGKGAERYNLDKDGYHPFDERDIINKALKERKRNEDKT